MLLYIVRHGDPIYVTDSLTEKGKLQAEAVGKRIHAAGVQQIYSSPMGRAKDTAAPACRLLGLEMQIEEWAHEVGPERLTEFPYVVKKSISMIPNFYYREKGGIDLPFDRSYECQGFNDTEMETATKYIVDNGREFLERLGYKEENGVYRILRQNEDRVALFCHSVMARAWISHLLHITIHLMWAGFYYTHTGVTVLQFENHAEGFTAPRCLCYSDVSHLYAEGLELNYDNKIPF